MTGRHAYLILAHNEFEVLQHLISALDDERNDIFVHIDGKVKELPVLHTNKSQLVILDKRIKTFWGDTTLMEAEFSLLRTAAAHDNYSFYHIISGVHLPLKNQDFIHSYFVKNSGLSVLLPMETSAKEVEYKFGKRHFFVRGQSTANPVLKKISNYLWRFALICQSCLPKRNCEDISIKASQWCSLSGKAVDCILNNYDKARKRFRHSFCCDEFFIPFILKTNNIEWISDSNLLYMKFRIFSPKVLNEDDYGDIISSDCLFARKFSSQNKLMNQISQCNQ